MLQPEEPSHKPKPEFQPCLLNRAGLALAALSTQGVVIAIAVLLYHVAPKGNWPLVANAMGAYAASGCLLLIVVWKPARLILGQRIATAGNLLGYVEFSMRIAAGLAILVMLVIVLCKMVGVL